MDTEQEIVNLYSRGSKTVDPHRRVQYWHGEEKNEDLHKHENFDYYFNNYGFRSLREEDYNLYDENDIWCFGCSFTVGIGVSRLKNWPAVINRITKRQVKNFGVGGCGPKTMYRLMANWYDNVKFKPRKILVLGSFDGRDEKWDDSQKYYLHQTVQNTYGLEYDIDKIHDMYIETHNKIKNFKDTILISPNLMLEESKRVGMNDRGRDNSKGLIQNHNFHGHPGIKFHNFVAEEFIKHL